MTIAYLHVVVIAERGDAEKEEDGHLRYVGQQVHTHPHCCARRLANILDRYIDRYIDI